MHTPVSAARNRAAAFSLHVQGRVAILGARENSH
jgi:hypothetical protein